MRGLDGRGALVTVPQRLIHVLTIVRLCGRFDAHRG